MALTVILLQDETVPQATTALMQMDIIHILDINPLHVILSDISCTLNKHTYNVSYTQTHTAQSGGRK